MPERRRAQTPAGTPTVTQTGTQTQTCDTTNTSEWWIDPAIVRRYLQTTQYRPAIIDTTGEATAPFSLGADTMDDWLDSIHNLNRPENRSEPVFVAKVMICPHCEGMMMVTVRNEEFPKLTSQRCPNCERTTILEAPDRENMKLRKVD